MGFDITGLLENLEKYLGKTVTAIFVAVVSLAVVAFSINVIVVNIIAPTLSMLSGLEIDGGDIANLGVSLTAIGMGIMVGVEARQASQARALILDAKQQLQLNKESGREVRRVTEDLITTLKDRGAIDPDLADEFLADVRRLTDSAEAAAIPR